MVTRDELGIHIYALPLNKSNLRFQGLYQGGIKLNRTTGTV